MYMLSVQLSTQVHRCDSKKLKVNLARLIVEIATSQTFSSQQTSYLHYKEKLQL